MARTRSRGGTSGRGAPCPCRRSGPARCSSGSRGCRRATRAVGRCGSMCECGSISGILTISAYRSWTSWSAAMRAPPEGMSGRVLQSRGKNCNDSQGFPGGARKRRMRRSRRIFLRDCPAGTCIRQTAGIMGRSPRDWRRACLKKSVFGTPARGRTERIASPGGRRFSRSGKSSRPLDAVPPALNGCRLVNAFMGRPILPPGPAVPAPGPPPLYPDLPSPEFMVLAGSYCATFVLAF